MAQTGWSTHDLAHLAHGHPMAQRLKKAIIWIGI
jgi:hypothetical protein